MKPELVLQLVRSEVIAIVNEDDDDSTAKSASMSAVARHEERTCTSLKNPPID